MIFSSRRTREVTVKRDNASQGSHGNYPESLQTVGTHLAFRSSRSAAGGSVTALGEKSEARVDWIVFFMNPDADVQRRDVLTGFSENLRVINTRDPERFLQAECESIQEEL